MAVQMGEKCSKIAVVVVVVGYPAWVTVKPTVRSVFFFLLTNSFQMDFGFFGINYKTLPI